MARLARVVAPGYPHHITQRGNRRQETFFRKEDYELYIELMSEFCAKRNVAIWAYCLMPNHVHLIAVPETTDGLRRAIGDAHRRYSRHINFREGWRGHLWQGRFASFVMDESYTLAAVRYIEMNPVRAGLVKKPWDYPWSSAKAHISGRNDELVKVRPLVNMVNDWKEFIMKSSENETSDTLKRHERTGRPLGARDFVTNLGNKLDRKLLPEKPGPKPKKRKS